MVGLFLVWHTESHPYSCQRSNCGLSAGEGIELSGIYHLSFLVTMTKAAITPGTQPQIVRIENSMILPHPWSSTLSGGKMIHNNTRRQPMRLK